MLKLKLTTNLLSVQQNLKYVCAFYSRRSDSSSNDSFFKVVKGKVRLEDESNFLGGEGQANWELLAWKSNRFFLPGLLGPAWQGETTTITVDTALDNLVDFQAKDNKKLHVSSQECPVLLRKNLHELFPTPEVVALNSNLTMITLSSQINNESEIGAKNFVLAAREICARLRLNGFWADFMNPFSGRPFHSYSSGRNLYKIDERFRGIGIKMEKQQNCMIISPDEQISFSGNIFTNAPSNLPLLQDLIME